MVISYNLKPLIEQRRYVQGAAEQDMAPADTIATFRGNWLSHFDISHTGTPSHSERLWTLTDCEWDGFVDVAEHERLPSDSSWRDDLQLLAAGDVKAAGVAKQRIEDQQRKIRKSRNSYCYSNMHLQF